MNDTALNDKLLLRTASLWNIEPVRVHRSVEISGSPERSELRYVIEGAGQKRYVLESILNKDLEIKKNIIDRLNALKSEKLYGINTYLESVSQNFIEQFMGRYWKLSRFIDGCALKRPEYVFDKWRGEVLADFLIRLREISDNFSQLPAGTVFSLREYIIKLTSEIEEFNPSVFEELRPVISFLDKGFMMEHDNLETAFCHGDYHPVNVIWGREDIAAVIDWEFCGEKPEIYDAANLIGCLGIEQPDSLTGPFSLAFIDSLKEANLFSALSWQNLISFIVAIRFAWLAEWLRKKDTEMINMELVYMKILVQNEKQLTKIWEL